MAGGSIRSSADVVKAIALGADAVYIGTSALLALGCHLCRSCHAGQMQLGHRHPASRTGQAAESRRLGPSGW